MLSAIWGQKYREGCVITWMIPLGCGENKELIGQLNGILGDFADGRGLYDKLINEARVSSGQPPEYLGG